jgi:hypothetical protein
MTLVHLVVILSLAFVCCASGIACAAEVVPGRWSQKKATDWYDAQPWLVGCNFVPSTAVNQLEMWQADSFDLATIDRELALCQGLGFNSARVFLHDMVWEQDSKGFLDRIDQFLAVAGKHNIGVMFVLLDGCWDPHPQPGKQRDPKPHVHNSGWVQSPSCDVLKDPSKHAALAAYVKGVIGRFKDDPRVQMWDIYNEPDNTNVNAFGEVELPDKPQLALALITKAFAWARGVNPSQPITTGVWAGSWKSLDEMSPMTRFCVQQSDIITFHSYTPLDELRPRVEQLRQFNRPLLCTEYMARPVGSTFETILPYFKEYKIAAYNWGCVDGKCQTIYPWDSCKKQYTCEPPVWFHDIFRKDGKPYREEEAKLIKRLTAAR